MEGRIQQVADVQEVLRSVFGFDSLRTGQDAVVDAIMAGRDALAIMPTGGGKSLCYQLPALCREGLTIVVSPLIALMKDQVDALQARGVPAAAVNSSLGADEYRQVMAALRSGELRIIYVAPERFGQEGFMNMLRSMQVGLLAIDEAHCLSQWGHDFRPDYLRLGRVRQELGCPQTVALTATATDAVRQDILNTLQLNTPAVIISGFGRDNLDFAITHCENRQAKFERIRKVIAQWRKGIIYCSTRKNVMTVFDEISGTGANAVAYHAGMTDEEREFSQNAFISGRADVVVATNAFGMGIDRPDVRFVLHFEIPGSVEAYYQEAGRAGRDGELSACELLFNHADLKTQEFFFEGSNPSVQTIRSVYNLLRARCNADTGELQMTVDHMAAELGKDVNPMAVGTALSALIHAGAITRSDVPGSNTRLTRVLNPGTPFASLPIDTNAIDEKARRDHKKIEAITRYAYSTGCRQRWILDYFGEPSACDCGHCDVCNAEEPGDAEDIEGEDLVIVRKALAGVARASRRQPDGSWQAIFGRAKIADMLRGSQRAGLPPQLTRLSTYGLLSNMTGAKLRALFRAMQEGGLITTTGGELPLITLTAKGEDVMKEKAPARLTTRIWSRTAIKQPRTSTLRRRSERVLNAMQLGRPDKALFDHLTELRRDLAAEYRMPVYRILNTDTLRALATVKPTTIEAASRLKGVGPWAKQHVLRAFVELIQDYEES
ncbi:MAG: RecQ family ATP-dependent DNA helicase [Akkermansia sp.]|nr:RecQ family ATP-dependent DNA helicase [Akkermansia sp.]